MEKEKLERLLNVAIKVLLGDEHEENGTYSLYDTTAGKPTISMVG